MEEDRYEHKNFWLPTVGEKCMQVPSVEINSTKAFRNQEEAEKVWKPHFVLFSPDADRLLFLQNLLENVEGFEEESKRGLRTRDDPRTSTCTRQQDFKKALELPAGYYLLRSFAFLIYAVLTGRSYSSVSRGKEDTNNRERNASRGFLPTK